MTSRGVDSTSGHCVPDDLRAIGFLAARRRACFHVRRSLPRPTVRRPFRAGFIPSCRVSPSEFLRRSSCSLVSERAVLPGFPPSSRRDRRCPLGAAASQAPATFRPQVFSTSRRLAPPSTLRAYFIPQPRPGCLLRPGVSPNPQPSRLVAGRDPHAVDIRRLTGKPAATVE